jgi:hypothetical protein
MGIFSDGPCIRLRSVGDDDDVDVDDVGSASGDDDISMYTRFFLRISKHSERLQFGDRLLKTRSARNNFFCCPSEAFFFFFLLVDVFCVGPSVSSSS